jgi:hypothetical protein
MCSFTSFSCPWIRIPNPDPQSHFKILFHNPLIALLLFNVYRMNGRENLSHQKLPVYV